MFDSNDFFVLVVIAFVDFTITALAKSSVQVDAEPRGNRKHVRLHWKKRYYYINKSKDDQVPR